MQSKLHRRIEEALDRRERDHEPFGDAAERQADFETILRHYQIPELMLQNEGHLLGILRQDAWRQPDPFGPGREGNIEMMIAGKAVLGGIGQHGSHDSAQGLLGEDIVTNVIDSHRGAVRFSLQADFRTAVLSPKKTGLGLTNTDANMTLESGGFCCQVPPNPACRSLTRQGFKIGIPNCVTQPGQPEHSCRWQL